MERARLSGEPYGLPDIDFGRYLIDAFHALGPVRSTGMDERSTDWPEIDAFMRCTGRISEPWEAETLRDMCVGYLAARHAGDHPLARPPVDRGIDKRVLAKGIRDAIREGQRARS